MAYISSGKRNTRVSFQRNSAGRSALGGRASANWGELFSRLASVTWGSSAERRSAAVEGAVQSATFRVLADQDTRGVLVTDRIVVTVAGHMLEGIAFDITGSVPIGAPVPHEIEFTCTANRG
ncbi:MAG: hypothetical protein Q8R81_09470 [Novosphingobium sp.]|nr:hypothetical protein [Novosphingobium sp.]